MILAPLDPGGNAWDEAALHALGASTIAYPEGSGPVVLPDLDLSGYAAALSAAAAAAVAAGAPVECQRRIYAQVSDVAQSNITAYTAKLTKDAVVLSVALTDAQKADLALADAIYEWINGASGMLATSRALVVAADADYAQDAKWPAWDPGNAGWTAFVSRF